ncbi:MAG: hypothetical protein HKN94_12380 [Acidimicrobiales bacterium]|nr:hypothetical protein [Acidimicrobiales bacterium]RZV42967.1 MAG: hypothetical protein EX269_14055 [Acidimicrobiales bacterium]
MSSGTEPSESEIFAASDPFIESTEPFVGVDMFSAGRPTPTFGQPPVVAQDAVSCVMVQPSLPIFLDGELAGPQHRAVEAHLAACPSCSRAHNFQARLRGVVASKALEQPPADLRSRIEQALRLEQS